MYKCNAKFKSFNSKLKLLIILLGAAVSSMSRLLHVKTHGSSLRLYHLWLPLPIPMALLRNYVSDKSDMQDSDIGSDIED